MNEKTREQIFSMLTSERLGRIDDVLNKRAGNLTILLDRLFHPHNIAAILRTAEAFGLCKVHIVEGGVEEISEVSGGKDDPQKSPGVSLGTEKWIDLKRFATAELAISTLKNEGYTLVCLAPPALDSDNIANSTPVIPVSELPFEEKLCLVFGSELQGLSPILKSNADILAYIPMYGFVESFNVSVACGISLFCSTLPKVSPERRVVPLSENDKNIIRDDWAVKSVPHGKRVVDYIEKASS